MDDLEQLVPSTAREDSDGEDASFATSVLPTHQRPSINATSIMEQSWCSVRQRVIGAAPSIHGSHEINENIAPQYESLDYDICENTLLRKEEDAKGDKFVFKKRIARWFVFLLIGVVTALIACCIDIAIEELSSIKFRFLKYYVDLCLNDRCMHVPLLYWVATNIVPVLIGTILVTYLEPVAAGSGIPQVKCYLNGVKVPRIVRIKTLLVKSIGVTCSVLGGLAVGKEGPMIHSGAVVAAGISQGKTTSLSKDFHFFNYFREDHEKRDFVSGGAAAGVAAAFGAPMGGVLFSLEEGSSFWNQSLTWRIFFASMISTFTLNVILSAYHGFPGQLTYSGLLNFGAFPNISYEFFEIPLFVLMGVLGGVLGALFNFVNLKLTLFRNRYITKKWLKVVEVLVVSSVSATVAFAMIMLIDDCRPLGQDPTKYPVQLYCGDGEYSAVASIWFQNPEASVRSLFHDPPGSHNPCTVGVFFIIYFALSCWTYGLSVSSGLFIPSLLTGAAWGRLAGMFLEFLFPNAAWTNPGKYALIGAASQLGGNVRMTISLTVILIEATANITFGLPLMITLITAKWIGDLFNEGIYDLHIHLSGVPILGWEPPQLSHNIFASQFMSYPVVKFNCIESVARIVDILRNTIHSGYPVVTSIHDPHNPQGEPGTQLCGLILRSQLIVILQNKIFVENKEDWLGKAITLKLFRDAYPRYPKIEQIFVSDLERSFTIDLRNFMNPAPYTVPMAASLPRVFKLFRGLGLRHLPVLDNRFELVGIVTRKDLAKYGTNH